MSDQAKTGEYMTDFEKQVLTTLTELKTLMTEDHLLLRGNGHPGLVDRVANLESSVGMVTNVKGMLDSLVDIKADILLLKHNRKWWHTLVVDGVAIISLGVCIYCAFVK